jgi:hypothetical protein
MNNICLLLLAVGVAFLHPAFADLQSSNVAARSHVDVVLSPGGVVSVGNTDIRPFASLLGWKGAAAKGVYEHAISGTSRFRFESGGRAIADVAVSLANLAGGKVRIDYRIAAVSGFETESIGCTMKLPAHLQEGLEWRVDSRCGAFARPAQGEPRLTSGSFGKFGFPLAKEGVTICFVTTNSVKHLIQDSRRWEDVYTVRIGELGRRSFSKGEVLSFSLVMSADVPLVAADWKPHVISAGKEWIPLDYCRDIEPGSALDFSGMGFADAPAGKYGWLKNAGGRFEFEKLPGNGQRFYGVNLVGTANFPDHALADSLVARFKRFGYNTIRIHHHDAPTVEGSADGLTLNAANMDRLDYLVAAAVREGLYITTDLYVSRKVKWRHIGIDRDGTIDVQLFKALCAVYEPAFRNWATYAKNFLLHRNRYTGRRYVDEPAMPLVSLVNEGGFFMGWTRGISKDPHVLESWRSWLAGKRAADPGYAPGLGEKELPENFWSDGIKPAIAEWTGCLEAKMVARMKAYLRGLGCRALLSNDNCGPHYAALQCATADYDYIDDHFYVDHPSFPEKRWSLPSVCPNVNPLPGTGTLSPSAQAFARMLDKPFTVTEWNFAGPGRYRGVGGILTGAMAALQDWDGLWRFAYAHSRNGLGAKDVRSQSYFDLASDPLAQASERACLCLFMRGDIQPLTNGVALLVTPESVSHNKVLRGAPGWMNSAWSMRTGSCLSVEAAGGLDIIRREEAESNASRRVVKTAERQTPLCIDRKRGAFTIDTPRTCGGFAPEGEIDAGALKASVSGSPATVWVHSLDGAPVDRSRRLLLTHLTDVQGDGAAFTDESMKVLLEWGGKPVVRAGEAKIRLRRSDSDKCAVYRLDTSGKRIGRVASKSEAGCLTFVANVSCGASAAICYEICSEGEAPVSAGRSESCLGSPDIDVEWLFRGDSRTAYRDPAAEWVDGVCHLFFTLVETDAEGAVYSHIATSQSRDLKNWSKVRKLTPRTDRDYSSPGNLVKDGDDWVLCFQSYPRPGNRNDGVVRYADRTARLFTMRTRDFKVWSSPELLRVKGPNVPESEMGRMIDPYLVRCPSGGWMCFYKQHGASFSRSQDLREWTFAGRTDAGENVCIVQEDGSYWMMHSPQNGMRLKRSDDMMEWTDVSGRITLGQTRWPWARGRITAGFLLDCSRIRKEKWGLFFHASGPRTEDEGDFDRNASIGVAFSSSLDGFTDKTFADGRNGK